MLLYKYFNWTTKDRHNKDCFFHSDKITINELDDMSWWMSMNVLSKVVNICVNNTFLYYCQWIEW
jgi:hypothetical protein